MDSEKHTSSGGENAETENKGLDTFAKAEKMEMGKENSNNRWRLVDSKGFEMGPVTTEDLVRKPKRGKT